MLKLFKRPPFLNHAILYFQPGQVSNLSSFLNTFYPHSSSCLVCCSYPVRQYASNQTDKRLVTYNALLYLAIMADSRDFPLKNAVKRAERVTKDFQVRHESIHCSSKIFINDHMFSRMRRNIQRSSKKTFVNLRSRILKFLITNFVLIIFNR